MWKIRSLTHGNKVNTTDIEGKYITLVKNMWSVVNMCA